jgi:dUTP pyrophosphatase
MSRDRGRPHVTLKRLEETARFPARATSGSFGYDLATVGEERIGSRETRLVPCGFQLAHDLPHDETGGLAMLVMPRSSLPIKWGLMMPNSIGLVDADYSGPLKVLVHNLTDRPVVVPPDTRIAQAVFVRVVHPLLDEVSEIDESRDRGGFGSTG